MSIEYWSVVVFRNTSYWVPHIFTVFFSENLPAPLQFPVWIFTWAGLTNEDSILRKLCWKSRFMINPPGQPRPPIMQTTLTVKFNHDKNCFVAVPAHFLKTEALSVLKCEWFHQTQKRVFVSVSPSRIAKPGRNCANVKNAQWQGGYRQNQNLIFYILFSWWQSGKDKFLRPELL